MAYDGAEAEISAFAQYWSPAIDIIEVLPSVPDAQWAKLRAKIATFVASLRNANTKDLTEASRRRSFSDWWTGFDAELGNATPTLGKWSALKQRVNSFLKGKGRVFVGQEDEEDEPLPAPPVVSVVSLLPENGVAKPESMDVDERVEWFGDDESETVVNSANGNELAVKPGSEFAEEAPEPSPPEREVEMEPATPVTPTTPLTPTSRKRPTEIGFGTSSLKRFRLEDQISRSHKYFIEDLMTSDQLQNYGSLRVVEPAPNEGSASADNGGSSAAGAAAASLRRRSARLVLDEERKKQQEDPASPIQNDGLFSQRVPKEQLLIPFGWLQVDLRDEDQVVEVLDETVWETFGTPKEKKERDRILGSNEWYRNEEELARLRERNKKLERELELAVDEVSRTRLKQREEELHERMSELRGKNTHLEFKYGNPRVPDKLPKEAKNDSVIPVTLLWHLPPISKKKSVPWELVLARGLETDGRPAPYLDYNTIPKENIILRSPLEQHGKIEQWIPALRVLHEKKYFKLQAFLEFDSVEGLFVRLGVHLTEWALRYGTDDADDGSLTLDMVSQDERRMGTMFEELLDQTRLLVPYMKVDALEEDAYFRSTATYHNTAGIALNIPRTIAGMLESVRPPLDCEEAAPPAGLSPDTTLHPYQRRNLFWMLRKEDPSFHPDNQLLHPSWIPVQMSKTMWEGIANSKMTTPEVLEDMFVEEAAGKGNAPTGPDEMPDLTTVYMNEVTGTLSQKRFTVPQPNPGGILADEMGLGKTVEMISLILANPRKDLEGLDPSRGIEHVREWLDDKDPGVLPVKATLIIVPKNLLDQWKDELEEHAPNLRVKLYTRTIKTVGAWWTNPRRMEYAMREFVDVDVVLTSFDQVPKDSQELETVQWWRVIIDEAQEVRDEEREVSVRASNLFRINSWVVTGTPVYADITDLLGYLVFLGLDPFLDPDVFKHSVVDQYLDMASQKGMMRVHGLLPKIMRRYSKKHIAEEFPVPPMTEIELPVKLSGREKWFYQKIRSNAKTALDRYIKDANINKSKKLNQKQKTTIQNAVQDLRRRACLSVARGGQAPFNDMKVETDVVKKMPVDAILQLARKKRKDALESRRGEAVRASALYLASRSDKSPGTSGPGSEDGIDTDEDSESEAEEDVQTPVTDGTRLSDAAALVLEAINEGTYLQYLGTDVAWDDIKKAIKRISGYPVVKGENRRRELNTLNTLVAQQQQQRRSRTARIEKPNEARKKLDKALKALRLARSNVNHVEGAIATEFEIPPLCANCNDIMTAPVVCLCCKLEPYSCFGCYMTWRDKHSQKKLTCYYCRKSIKMDQLIIVTQQDADELGNDAIDAEAPSFGNEDPMVVEFGSKIVAVVADMTRRFKEDSFAKAIVFSQFTDVYKDMAAALRKVGIGGVEYTSGEKARAALRAIKEDPEVRVIVMPLRGQSAAGLTLTCCNIVYLMDPTIVPGLEDQAINRIHRMGQTRPTTAIHVIAEGTVERHVMQVQEDKRRHATVAGGTYLGIAKEKKADFGIPEWLKLLSDEPESEPATEAPVAGPSTL